MSTKARHLTDVDIDPGCYPGQPELQNADGPAPEPLLTSDGASPQLMAPQAVATAASAGFPARVPTVLTKLQKWGDYESVGGQVLHTKFIPMKTPLSAEILDSWSLPTQPKHRLTVPEMVAQQAALGRKVGLLLDLSNHDCLYSADIPAGLAYMHVQLVAKELPPREFVDAVVAVANKFWAQHPDEYIAVHCAYGFNRTGFVVCCYLIECCGLSVEDALVAFAESRPPGVKHEQFRNELHRRYGLQGSGAPGLCGSPDDNSSFGYSPSCNSLDLRDMCGFGGIFGFGYGSGGGSPVPALTRGATFDGLLAPPRLPSALAGGGGGGTPVIHRHSMDGHQTMTFTTSSFALELRRDSSGGGCGCGSGSGGLKLPPPVPAEAGPGALTRTQSHRGAQALPAHGRRASTQGGQQQQPLGEERIAQGDDPLRAEEEQQDVGGYGQQPSGLRTSGQPLPAASGCPLVGERHGGSGSSVSSEPAISTTAAPAPATTTLTSDLAPAAAAAEGGGGSSSAGASTGCGSMSRAASQHQLQRCCSNDNESLGVNDRIILQTLRQQALAQLSPATIPEESGSAHSTPARGCSSISLADCDSTAGHSTPRPAQPGKYSHKSLDTIDWGAAAATDDGGSCVGTGAESPVPEVEALRLK